MAMTMTMMVVKAVPMARHNEVWHSKAGRQRCTVCRASFLRLRALSRPICSEFLVAGFSQQRLCGSRSNLIDVPLLQPAAWFVVCLNLSLPVVWSPQQPGRLVPRKLRDRPALQDLPVARHAGGERVAGGHIADELLLRLPEVRFGTRSGLMCASCLLSSVTKRPPHCSRGNNAIMFGTCS